MAPCCPPDSERRRGTGRVLIGAALLVIAIGHGVHVTAAQERRSIWDSIYSSAQAQAQRGAALYREGCAECHGDGLEGGEMEPGQPASMNRREKADVMAFLLAENGVPPGDVELAGRSRSLTGIVFEARPER